MELTDFYVRDKYTGRIHRVGEDGHDSVWVDSNGTLHFFNLQNGDGCGENSIFDEEAGYEFCPSDNGCIYKEYFEKHKNDYDEYLKKHGGK